MTSDGEAPHLPLQITPCLQSHTCAFSTSRPCNIGGLSGGSTMVAREGQGPPLFRLPSTPPQFAMFNVCIIIVYC